MLDIDNNKSAMSRASVYCWYNEFKSDRKSVELIGRRIIPTTALLKHTINTSATMILDDSHLTVRKLASFLGISIQSPSFWSNSIFLICILGRFHVYFYHKKSSCWSVPISDRAGSQLHGLFELCNYCRQDVHLLLRSHIQATGERMGSSRFFSPAKTTHHKIKNEMHGYHILRWGMHGTRTHCGIWLNSQSRLVHQNPDVTYYSAYPT